MKDTELCSEIDTIIGKRKSNAMPGGYLKICRQEFWEFISNDSNLYRDIIEPLGHKAKERNDEFNELYGKRLNLFVKEFVDNFCKEDGAIDWDKLIQFNSGKEQPKLTAKTNQNSISRYGTKSNVKRRI